MSRSTKPRERESLRAILAAPFAALGRASWPRRLLAAAIAGMALVAGRSPYGPKCGPTFSRNLSICAHQRTGNNSAAGLDPRQY